jgi:molybdopterin converting factor small subunit
MSDDDSALRSRPLELLHMNAPADYAEALQRSSHAPVPGPGPHASIQCIVELFGAARFIAHTREVTLTLPEGATFSLVYASLAEKLPILVGRIINPDRARLMDGFACNVNGLDFVRTPTATVNAGDNILVLSADAGG